VLLFITVLHVILCIALILIILLQPGKDQGAIFGGGGGNRMYAPRGQAHFLGRATTAVAVLFMVTSISLAWFSTESARNASGVDLESLDGAGSDDEEVGFGIDVEEPTPDATTPDATTPAEEAPTREEAPMDAAPEEDGEAPEAPPTENTPE